MDVVLLTVTKGNRISRLPDGVIEHRTVQQLMNDIFRWFGPLWGTVWCFLIDFYRFRSPLAYVRV